jgi:hypothetical protein
MRDRAAYSADRISGCVIVTTGLLSGVLLFVVALPLALSNPFPTPKQSEWIIQPSLQSSAVAAAPAMPALIDTPPEINPLAFAARWTGANGRRNDITGATPTQPVRLAMADESVPIAEAPVQIAVPAAAARIKPAARKTAAAPPKKPVNPMDQVDRYLWDVYQRMPVKSDSSGDFTWKDIAAAKRRGMSLKAYVIGGMDPDFREQLYHAGRAMDARGIRWSMLSAFRDDYRQGLAAGFKAHGGNSLHGGSSATGGYGYGRAVDVSCVEGEAEDVWHWVDAHGAKYGLRRPMPGYDPAHIQAGGAWHDIAQALRAGRTKIAGGPRWPGLVTAKTKAGARASM